MSYLTEPMIINGHPLGTPIERLRRLADSVENFWGPVAARGLQPEPNKKIPEDDHTLKIAREDALCMREIADLLEAQTPFLAKDTVRGT
jgi:hypothetical protein